MSKKSKKIGLLLRSYAKKQEDVQGVVERAQKSIEHAKNLLDESGQRVFSAIVVLVPVDYDCGSTSKEIAVVRHWFIDHDNGVYVLDVSGHHSCGVLNHGIEFLAELGVDYAVIISNKAIQALTSGVMKAMFEAFDDGAKVVGVAVDELHDVVLKGRIQNTFAAWEIHALRDVGSFDSETGVEEVAPTVRLIREYGQCIAVLDPKEKPALDIRKTADGDARHQEVMTTKIARQQEEVHRVGADFDFIKSGIMSGYPQSV